MHCDKKQCEALYLNCAPEPSLIKFEQFHEHASPAAPVMLASLAHEVSSVSKYSSQSTKFSNEAEVSSLALCKHTGPAAVGSNSVTPPSSDYDFDTRIDGFLCALHWRETSITASYAVSYIQGVVLGVVDFIVTTVHQKAVGCRAI